MRLTKRIVFFIIFIYSGLIYAVAGRSMDVTVLSGPLIPDTIPDLDSPITLHTIKVAWNGAFNYEAKLGVQVLSLGYFVNPSISIKAEMTDGDLIWYTFMGADLYNWKNSEARYHFSAGADFGAGVYVPLSGSLQFCSEIKTNLSPGTSFYWGNGFTWFFGGGSGGK